MGVKMRIRAEVEVEVGTWGDDCKFSELTERVKREGVDEINQKLKSIGRVIGRPTVLAIIVLEDNAKGGES